MGSLADELKKLEDQLRGIRAPTKEGNGHNYNHHQRANRIKAIREIAQSRPKAKKETAP